MSGFRARVLATASLISLSAVGTLAQTPAPAPNPFLEASSLPYHAPPFDQIKDADFGPAFDEGMKRQMAEIDAIADNPAAPTVENTLVAMERSGLMLERVNNAFFALAQANTDEAIQKLRAIEAPKLAAHQDAIYLNAKLFARVQALYDQRDKLKLDPETRRLIEIDYQDFTLAGAKLSDADKVKLRALNEQISTLQTTFQRDLLAATKAGAVTVDDKAALAGFDDAAMAAAASAAADRGLKGQWTIPLQNTTQQPSLVSLESRSTRQALFGNGWTRAEKGDANDTRATIATLASLRAQKAQLLGYPTFAAYKLSDQMAKTPQAVEAFVSQLVPPTATKARGEAADIQAVIDKTGQPFKLEPWDWDHYAEQVRKARYDLDDNQLRPYFELNHVLENGVFYAANQLYGVTFRRRTDIPVYQSDVMVYEVFDQDGSPLGLMYFDYFKRDNKSGGAWMGSLVAQSKLLGDKPVIYNVANFTKPAAGQPDLITFDDVTTMFHEFGHALHGLFADQQYPSLSGTRVARDFVEFPSQFNEHWALYPKVLANYAKDYRTGAPMPQALADKIRKAATFNQGYDLGEILAAAQLDMGWHTLSASAPKQDVDAFETATLKASGTDFADVPPRYRSSYFSHIWSSGYAAGYYAYLWTEMLDDDAFHWFDTHGGMTRANGQRFRDMILSRGNTLDYGEMFRAFYGADPQIGPMLEHRGLPPPAS